MNPNPLHSLSLAALAVLLGCGPGAMYQRPGMDSSGSGGQVDDASVATGGSGGASTTGTGGMLIATGGATGSGGAGSMGVRMTWPARTPRARSISAMVRVKPASRMSRPIPPGE